jgi:hypothetical protein
MIINTSKVNIMKKSFRLWLFAMVTVITGVSLILFLMPAGCKKEAMIPTVTTFHATDITETSFSGGGQISSDGGATITERGVCWSKGEMPTTDDDKTMDGQGSGGFLSSVTGLSPSTLYHIRAYASNSAGTAYGNVMSVHTWSGTVKDIEDNVYPTIIIGKQEWMGKNLNARRSGPVAKHKSTLLHGNQRILL